jgi:hypothetical protein
VDLSGVLQKFKIPINSGRGLCGHDHMVVGFTTTCAISAETCFKYTIPCMGSRNMIA